MASTFDPTLQHLASIDRVERALARVHALRVGKKFDGRRLSSKSGYTKNGMFADIYKTLVSSAAATARSAELVCFHRRHLGQKVLRAACLTPPAAGVGAPAVQLGGIDASGRGGIDEVPDRLVIASSRAPSLGRQRSGSVQPTTTISSRCRQLARSPRSS